MDFLLRNYSKVYRHIENDWSTDGLNAEQEEKVAMKKGQNVS